MKLLTNYINSLPKYTVLLALIVFMFLGLTSVVARGMLVIIFIAIIVSIADCIKYSHRNEVGAILILLIVNSILFIFGDVGRHSGFYANIVLNLGIFFFSYNLSEKGRLSEKEIVVTYILLLAATSYRFFVEREEMLFERNGNQGTINLAYAFVIYMPFVFYIRNKILSILLVLFALFMVLNGAKRGAIFIFVISALYYIYIVFVKQATKYKFLYVIIAVITLFAAFYLMKDVYLNNEYLQSRLDSTLEGNTNGRDYIFRTIFNKWTTESNFFRFLFGYGFCSSIDIAGNRAHNDWLEMMATGGLLGEVVYILYWIKLLNAQLYIKDELDKKAVTLILIILLLKSFFSMSYCSVENMAIFLLLGFLTGRNRLRRLAKQ